MPIVPDNNPNEAYEVVPMEQEPHGPPADWWTVTCNGVPVHHFSPRRKADAERYATDPAYRLSLVTTFLHDKK
jgi:hypothetical protein